MSVHRDVDAELRFHFEARIEELMEQGMSNDAARAQAHAEFGDVVATRTHLREIDRRVAKRRNRAEVIDALIQDVRYSLRSLRRAPAVSLTIILTLALGIGVNAAMFSLLDAIYLRPPAGVVDPGNVRRVWRETRFISGMQYWSGFDYAGYDAIAQSVGPQVTSTLFTTPRSRSIGRGENAPKVNEAGAGVNYFSLLGVKPAIGRFFSQDEAGVPATAPVAVISDDFWTRQFDRDPAVIGKELALGPQKLTVIGVAPPGFRGIELNATDVWLPLGTHLVGEGRLTKTPWWQSPHINGYQVILRLQPGEHEGEIVHRLTAAMRAPRLGDPPDTLAVMATGGINVARGPGKVSMEMQVAKRLVAVGVIVLLIACANVVNLLLARAVQRRREIAVRLALGISRQRLVRFLITESVLLALFAAVAALVAAKWGGALIRGLLMPSIQWTSTGLHWRVLLFALAAALIAGFLAGLIPAMQSSTPNLTDGLKAGVREGGIHRSRLRSFLIVAQAALCVVLLVGAVLFVQSLRNVKAHDIGFDVERLVFARASYDTRDSVRDAMYPARLRALEPAIASIPGVERVAFTSMRPKAGISFVRYYPEADTVAHKKPLLLYSAVSPGYFATIGTKVLQGNTFDSESARSGGVHVVINRQMADALWPNQNPIGRCIRFESATAACATIIGLVQTTLATSLNEKPWAHVYIALDRPALATWGASDIVIRANPARSAAVQAAVRDLLRRDFPGAIPQLNTMSKAMEPEYRPWDLGAKIFTAFGVLALVVAAIGVYSTVSYAVNQRTHEFGVRIALGAGVGDVLRQVLGEGLRTILVGIAAGVVLALAAGRFVASLLYGIEPHDPASMAIVTLVLIVIALVAAFRPAWRASRADPVTALRAD